MSFRSLQAYFPNLVQIDAGIQGLSSNNAVDTLHPLERLIDQRQSVSFKYDSAAADHHIDIDMGTTVSAKDTLIIPAGHNLDSVDCELLSGAAFPAATPRASFTPTGAGAIKESFPTNIDRHWRFKQTINGTHEFHQLVITFQFIFDRGIVMENVEDSFRYNFLRLTQPSGISPTLNLGARQRILEVQFESLRATDLSEVKQWIQRTGMQNTFWIDPPSFSGTPDSSDPVAWYKFDDVPDASNATSVPVNGIEKKDVSFLILENID